MAVESEYVDFFEESEEYLGEGHKHTVFEVQYRDDRNGSTHNVKTTWCSLSPDVETTIHEIICDDPHYVEEL